jgi:hypothetical protein
LKNKKIDSFAAQLRLSATAVLMRDINRKASDTDKPITNAIRHSIWLSYLLSLGAISAGGLSIFSVAAILDTKPAQADIKEPSSNVTDNADKFDRQNLSVWDASVTLTPKADASGEFDFAPHVLAQPQPSARAVVNTTPIALARPPRAIANSLSFVSAETVDNGNFLAQVPAPDKPNPVQPAYVPSPPVVLPTQNSVKGDSQAQVAATEASSTVKVVSTASSMTRESALNAVEDDSPEQVAATEESPAFELADAPLPTSSELTQNSVEGNSQQQVATEEESPTVKLASTPSPTANESTVYRGTGGASLLGDNLQAQTTVDDEQESPSLRESPTSELDPLAPTLRLQGLYVNQDGSSARARVTGIYPFSTNALVGGTVDLTAGDDFSDSQVGSLSINELYFTGSLPSLPNLRLTVGQVDLTSYFDRNSFAKDVGTHFFNPVFQTNPALAAAGIGPRPAALLNWNITDNVEAKVAAFSSSRNLSDFAIDAFAGELGFRVGNAIIRGTFASDRDAGRDGFQEIFGIDRGNGEFGPESGDRENAYGLNAEYFIPQINMGLFARYGHYENTELDEGADTYSVGLNFLDLFMPDDRLGFGYGRNLSNDELRRDNDDKVPDVWELFYDVRISPNFRAGATLQARDEFSDFVAGFRVRADFDLLGRLFR